jgi:hypothetical protein
MVPPPRVKSDGTFFPNGKLICRQDIRQGETLNIFPLANILLDDSAKELEKEEKVQKPHPRFRDKYKN